MTDKDLVIEFLMRTTNFTQQTEASTWLFELVMIWPPKMQEEMQKKLIKHISSKGLRRKMLNALIDDMFACEIIARNYHDQMFEFLSKDMTCS